MFLLKLIFRIIVKISLVDLYVWLISQMLKSLKSLLTEIFIQFQRCQCRWPTTWVSLIACWLNSTVLDTLKLLTRKNSMWRKMVVILSVRVVRISRHWARKVFRFQGYSRLITRAKLLHITHPGRPLLIYLKESNFYFKGKQFRMVVTLLVTEQSFEMRSKQYKLPLRSRSRVNEILKKSVMSQRKNIHQMIHSLIIVWKMAIRQTWMGNKPVKITQITTIPQSGII